MLCLQLTLQAADPPATSDRGEALRAWVQEVARQLNLTEEQKTKLKPILQADMQQLKAVRDDTSLSRREKLRKMRSVQQEFAPQIKAILTPEQAAKWQELRAERRAELRKHAGGL